LELQLKNELTNVTYRAVRFTPVNQVKSSSFLLISAYIHIPKQTIALGEQIKDKHTISFSFFGKRSRKNI